MRTSNGARSWSVTFAAFFALGSLVVVGGVAAPGCGGSDSPATGGGGSGGSGGGQAAGGSMVDDFGNSVCGVCAQKECSSFVDACNTDPECPDFFACVLACPNSAAGEVDATCAAKCGTGSTSESKFAAADILACFHGGAGKTECSACGADPSRNFVPPPAETCTPSTDSNACNKCFVSSCCDEIDACGTGSACDRMITCVQDCVSGGEGQGKCVNTCGADDEEGLAGLAALNACNVAHCESCNPADTCKTCQATTCEAELYALESDPLGFALFECFNDCLDTAGSVATCKSTCFANHPAQGDLFAAWSECLLIGCADACVP